MKNLPVVLVFFLEIIWLIIIYRKTSIVGITSLGLDHTTVLGNSLKEIAWQKSGIMKPNSVTIVINNQPKETIQTLIERSIEKQVRLWF